MRGVKETDTITSVLFYTLANGGFFPLRDALGERYDDLVDRDNTTMFYQQTGTSICIRFEVHNPRYPISFLLISVQLIGYDGVAVAHAGFFQS